MQKKWIFLIGALVCLMVAVWAYYSYQKPRAGIANANAHFTINAEALYKEFATDEASANNKYNEKIIAVSGMVTEVQKSDNATLVILKGGNDGGGVSCSFIIAKQDQNLPAIGTHVTIKGRCTGFLMDVNLVDAVFINNH